MKKILIGLMAFILVAGFFTLAFPQITGKYLGFTASRYWDNNGVLKTDSRIETWGTNNTIRLAYNDNLYTDIVANDEGELEIEKIVDNSSENESVLVFDITWQNVDEARQGVINIYAERDTAITSWGGSPDMVLKMAQRNTAASGVGVGHMRVVEGVASNRSTTGDVVVGYFSAESRSGSSSSNIISQWLIYDQSGNVNTNHMGLYIQDNSQSAVGTNYGINLTSTNYNITREFGYFLDSNAGSWTNGMSFNGTVTNVFDFEGTAGTSGAGYNASFATPSAFAVPDGYIKVDIGGNTQYIYTYTTLPTT